MLGNMTGAEASAELLLDVAEQQEALDLRALILAVTNNNATTQRLLRIAKAQEIENVLILLERGVAPFDTPAAVRARLGV